MNIKSITNKFFHENKKSMKDLANYDKGKKIKCCGKNWTTHQNGSFCPAPQSNSAHSHEGLYASECQLCFKGIPAPQEKEEEECSHKRKNCPVSSVCGASCAYKGICKKCGKQDFRGVCNKHRGKSPNLPLPRQAENSSVDKQDSWEEEFDKEFIGIYQSPHVLETFKGFNEKATVEKVKSFISSAIAKERDSIVEMLEGEIESIKNSPITDTSWAEFVRDGELNILQKFISKIKK